MLLWGHYAPLEVIVKCSDDLSESDHPTSFDQVIGQVCGEEERCD